MGAYINPPDMTKEEWLKRFAKPIREDWLVQGWDKFDGDELPVCLVFNGSFTAAGIIFDARERDAVFNPRDMRPKLFYAARRDDLLKVSNLAEYLK